MNSTAHSLFLKKSYPSQTNHSHGLWNAGDGDNEEPQQAAAYAASPSPEMEGGQGAIVSSDPRKGYPASSSRNKGWIWVRVERGTFLCMAQINSGPNIAGTDWILSPASVWLYSGSGCPSCLCFLWWLSLRSLPYHHGAPDGLCVSSSNFVIRKVLEIQNNFSNISNSNTRQWFQTLTRLTETTQ